jgi:3-deoxy-D-manno-octulosonic-acid transferase
MAGKDIYQHIFKLYDAVWRVCIPMLRLNSRLRDGFEARRSVGHLGPADLWIQAASAGEAYLASTVLKHLNPPRAVRILLTSNTRQGLEIINKGISDISTDNPKIFTVSSFFPFDRPAIMDAAIRKINPKTMVLLETEIWPGLLAALKKNNSRILIINGRITPKSLGRYMKCRKLLQSISPDRILAISKDDARRFGDLFGHDKVDVMHNIKFDQLDSSIKNNDNPLNKIIPGTSPFLVMGSVRKEEEAQADQIIREVSRQLPDTIIGIFPRHMHRINQWEQTLNQSGLKWKLRTNLNGEMTEKGTVILWDTFGELNHAYALADAVFVGGSLAPLGGQNFLEPLIYGIAPVIGPYWDNFTWVGEEIISQGMVIRAGDWQSVSSTLTDQLKHPTPKKVIREAAIRYITDRKGGAELACRLIRTELQMP